MHDTGCLGLVHWDDPEGWNGEGGGKRVQDGKKIKKKKKKRKKEKGTMITSLCLPELVKDPCREQAEQVPST